jgi:hypothetical protein
VHSGHQAPACGALVFSGKSGQAHLARDVVQNRKFGLLRLLDLQDLEGIHFKCCSDARRVDQFHGLGHCMETRQEVLYTYSTTAEH